MLRLRIAGRFGHRRVTEIDDVLALRRRWKLKTNTSKIGVVGITGVVVTVALRSVVDNGSHQSRGGTRWWKVVGG